MVNYSVRSVLLSEANDEGIFQDSALYNIIHIHSFQCATDSWIVFWLHGTGNRSYRALVHGSESSWSVTGSLQTLNKFVIYIDFSDWISSIAEHCIQCLFDCFWCPFNSGTSLCKIKMIKIFLLKFLFQNRKLLLLLWLSAYVIVLTLIIAKLFVTCGWFFYLLVAGRFSDSLSFLSSFAVQGVITCEKIKITTKNLINQHLFYSSNG